MDNPQNIKLTGEAKKKQIFKQLFSLLQMKYLSCQNNNDNISSTAQIFHFQKKKRRVS
jgi:hypothetical protein